MVDLSIFPMVDGTVSSPISMHVCPRSQDVFLEACLGLRLRVWAEAPLRTTSVICIQHNGRIEGLTRNILCGTIASRTLVVSKVVPRVARTLPRSAQAWRPRHCIQVHLPGRISRVMLTHTTWTIRRSFQHARKWLGHSTMALYSMKEGQCHHCCE
jgi:hypothetical protein